VGRFSSRDLPARRAVTKAIVEPIVIAKRDRKVAGTYKRFSPGPDGRIHTEVSPDTASWRLSSSETLLYKSTNLQNAEKKVARMDPLYQVRDVIIADEGKVLVSVDYSGAEAILVGAYSQDWTYVDELLAGKDTHLDLARYLWDDNSIEYEDIRRDIAKTLKYASSYVATVPTLQRHLNKDSDRTGMYFSQEEVRTYFSKLLQRHPLERWWLELRVELEKSGGVLRNCFGYRRIFRDPSPDSRLKDAAAFLPSSTVATLMNLALPKLPAAMQIHDELLFQSEPDAIPALIELATPVLERRFTIHDRELYIPTEWKSGTSWGSMKKLS